MNDLALFVPPSAADAWQAVTVPLGINSLAPKDLIAQNRGRWSDILLVVEGEKTPSVEALFSTVAPETIRFVQVGDNGPIRFDTSSYGIALSMGFSAMTLRANGDRTPLALLATTGPAAPTPNGSPPTLWPGFDAHGLDHVSVIACPETFRSVDPDEVREDVWIDGFPFRLPSKDGVLWHPLPSDPTRGHLLHLEDLGPLFHLPVTPSLTRSLSSLLPIATVRAIVRAVAPSLFLR